MLAFSVSGHYTVSMSQRAPGKHFRQGMSIKALFKLFPDDDAAAAWFVKVRWPDEIACHYCGSVRVQTGCKHKTMPYRCRDCRKWFSVRTGTVMQSSKLPLRDWAIAIYLVNTNLKGISSMKLHRELDITQKTAWHLSMRIREMLTDPNGPKMAGPVEADETYVGGRARNMHASKRRTLTGRGGVDKVAVAGVKDRPTGRVKAMVVEATDGPTLRGFVARNAADGATVYTDEAGAYNGLPNREAVRHSVGEYVRGQAHTNGIESFWSMLKRGYVGTFHKLSPEHLARYVCEFSGRHNARNRNTIDQMIGMVRGAEGKRLRYADLIDHGHGQQAEAS